jgi:leucyl/phenylalanyl-tRNA--protein transferase
LAYHADNLALSGASTAPLDRRARLFREGLAHKAERWALGAAYALMPKRIGGLPALAKMCFDEALAPNFALPDPEQALAQPPGLAGIVHDLSLPVLLAAYRRGLYPWAHLGPLKWWSPPQRSVLMFKDFHLSNNVRRLMRSGRYTVTFDRDFEAVIAACAGRRQGRWHLTWITPQMMRLYAQAYDAGHVHSFEVWNERGELAGGGYGIGYGGGFTSESQFTTESNAARIGMTVLNWHLAKWGYRFNDGKLIGPLWTSMGFHEMPRAQFLARVAEAVRAPGKSGRWQVEDDIDTISRWRRGERPTSPLPVEHAVHERNMRDQLADA